MATIIYFGTDGMPGHYPLGIDGNLSAEEYKKWNEFDIGDWIDHIRETQAIVEFFTMARFIQTMPSLSLWMTKETTVILNYSGKESIQRMKLLT